MASVYQASIDKWVILAGSLSSGMWKYVEP
jgi:hypothetical protein